MQGFNDLNREVKFRRISICIGAEHTQKAKQIEEELNALKIYFEKDNLDDVNIINAAFIDDKEALEFVKRWVNDITTTIRTKAFYDGEI